jgi:hypothetical protein
VPEEVFRRPACNELVFLPFANRTRQENLDSREICLPPFPLFVDCGIVVVGRQTIDV